jgi:Thiolase C-terminal domain-like
LPFVYVWTECLGLFPRGEARSVVENGGITSDRPGTLPVLSGEGALANGRMHGIPQMLEWYLQLSGRAADAFGPRFITGEHLRLQQAYPGEIAGAISPTTELVAEQMAEAMQAARLHRPIGAPPAPLPGPPPRTVAGRSALVGRLLY